MVLPYPHNKHFRILILALVQYIKRLRLRSFVQLIPLTYHYFVLESLLLSWLPCGITSQADPEWLSLTLPTHLAVSQWFPKEIFCRRKITWDSQWASWRWACWWYLYVVSGVYYTIHNFPHHAKSEGNALMSGDIQWNSFGGFTIRFHWNFYEAHRKG